MQYGACIRTMKRQSAFILIVLLAFSALAAENTTLDTHLDQYNVVWTSPSETSVDSMPCGGGNISLNVWTTSSELLFYIGSPDSWVDGDVPGKVAQVKLGRVRLRLWPNPFGRDFRQELDLATNSIRVSGQAEDGTAVGLRIWVDAFKPIVHVEGHASKPVTATVAVESWGKGRKGRFDDNSVMWHYRNEGPSLARKNSISRQGIKAIASSVPDPVENLTFGGRLTGAGFIADGNGKGTYEGITFKYWQLKTIEPVKEINIQATLRVEQDATIGDWEIAVTQLEEKTANTVKQDWETNAKWWREFWDRSYIVINPDKPSSDKAWQVGRNYQLFRAMLGANRSGKFPTLFNGGAFLCEANPDQRQWGHAAFTAQNQRLVYWPMLKSGDTDLMQVALDFYLSRLDVERAWAKHFWDIDGGVFPECPDVFGMPVRMARKDGTSKPDCLQYHFTSGMEFALMMLERRRYTGEDISRYVPVADAMLHFFDQYYRQRNKKNTGKELDENGKLVIFPGCGLELYTGTRNDSSTLAGLMAICDALLALPDGAVSTEDRKFYKEFRDRLAPIPKRTCKGHLCISPAESWQKERPDYNSELPQLYPVFPFKIYGIGRPGLETARNTWKYGFTDASKQKNYFCWFQGGIFTACLGLTEETKEYALAKFLHPHYDFPQPEKPEESPWKLHWKLTEGWKVPRYPAFWDCMLFDARPDMDHGGSAMIQLQEMLMQTVGDRIILLPAWPSDWDVDFKLHAPGQTIVEASVRKGKILNLKVVPELRLKDIKVSVPFELEKTQK